MTTQTQLKLNEFLPYRLSVLSNEVSQTIEGFYQQSFGINIHQWRVMAILGEQSNISAAEVSTRTAMDKVAVSRAVKKLLNQEMIIREFSDRDKRRSILRLSDKGRTIYSKIVPLAKDYEKKLLGHLELKEQSQLFSLIERLSKANHELSHSESN